MINDQQIQTLKRNIEQARLNYFHCMDYRLYDLAESARKQIEVYTKELNALGDYSFINN